MGLTRTYSGSTEDIDEIEDAAECEWVCANTRAALLVRVRDGVDRGKGALACEEKGNGAGGDASTRSGVAPRTAPSLRVERRRRARSAGASAFRVGGGAGAGREMFM